MTCRMILAHGCFPKQGYGHHLIEGYEKDPLFFYGACHIFIEEKRF